MKGSRSVFKTLLFFFMSCVLTINNFAYIMGNYSESIFCQDCESKLTVETRVINGGGYFLNAYAKILLFLNKIEVSDIQGIDYIELKEILGRAQDNMSQAKLTYDSLVELASITPFNPEAIRRLKIFDYAGFQQNNDLNPIIFKEVAGYLSHGNVRGFYSRLLANTGEILRQLNKIKSSIDSKKMPGITDLCGLSQACSETLLFGQYAAEIFSTLQ